MTSDVNRCKNVVENWIQLYVLEFITYEKGYFTRCWKEKNIRTFQL